MLTLSAKMEKIFDELWPLCRSITGDGYRNSLNILSKIMPMERFKFESGKKIFDWEIPKEWVIRDAYIVGPDGNKIAEFKKNNLHLMGYSCPYSGRMGLNDLKKHLYSIPDKPTAIPYVTSYYRENWGFCIAHNQFEALADGEYEVYIDSEFVDGYLEIGEAVLSGSTDREVLFSTYLCHPSMANHELGGPILMVYLYEILSNIKNRRFTYRFLICPETIGSLSYLSKRGAHLKEKLDAGYVITCVGDAGALTYKSSRSGDTLSDRAAKIALREVENYSLAPFTPFGSDERQFCSPGFNLPIGSLMRTMYGKFPEYHNSQDDKSFIKFSSIIDTLNYYKKIVDIIEGNCYLISRFPFGEPRLGKRGLYDEVSGVMDKKIDTETLMWVLNLSDGEHDLIDIAEKSGKPIDHVMEIANKAEHFGLVDKTFRGRNEPK
jgi:aminopeptidase-like protein